MSELPDEAVREVRERATWCAIRTSRSRRSASRRESRRHRRSGPRPGLGVTTGGEGKGRAACQETPTGPQEDTAVARRGTPQKRPPRASPVPACGSAGAYSARSLLGVGVAVAIESSLDCGMGARYEPPAARPSVVLRDCAAQAPRRSPAVLPRCDRAAAGLGSSHDARRPRDPLGRRLRRLTVIARGDPGGGPPRQARRAGHRRSRLRAALGPRRMAAA